MLPRRLALCGILIVPCSVAPAALAQSRAGCTIDIPAGKLGQALASLGRQTGASVATVVPGIGRNRVRAVRGCMDIETALRRMLAPSGLSALRVGPNAFRIVRAEPPRALPRPSLPLAAQAAEPSVGPDIVVTASKQHSPVERYPGSAQVVRFDALGLPLAAARGTRVLVEALTTLASTDLGPGRDKLFLRGIADSSFTGGSQATVGQYLGEVQLNYAAPDPDLALYDLERVEILQGPQGTLYGAGSLGGTVRVIPHAPVTGRWEGSLQSAVGVISHGGATADVGGALNVPVADGIAARIVGYAARTPGYIDAGPRENTNGSRRYGGRLAGVAELGGEWTAEVGGAFQSIRNRDAQYADGAGSALTRTGAIAQPSRNRFALGQLTLRKRQGEHPEFVATAGVVDNRVTARFDATALPISGLQTIDRDDHARLVTGEVRVARSSADGTGWVLGLHSTLSVSTRRNVPSPSIATLPASAVRNRALDTALFGQATVALTGRLQVTGGSRLAFILLKGAQLLPSPVAEGSSSFADRGKLAFVPGVAATWRFRSDLTGYVRYQRGFRVGGYEVVPSFEAGTGEPDVVANASDMLDMIEAGLRLGTADGPLTARVGVSTAWWRGLQADLPETAGPYVSNVGNGSVQGIELAADWSAPGGFDLSAGAFVAHSRVDGGYLETSYSGQPVPNIPTLTGRLSAARRFDIGSRGPLTVRADLRYVGRSYLGVGPVLHVPQGDYLETGMAGEYRRGRQTIFLDVRNLLDARGNTFASGNPLTAGVLDQRTPLRPRTLRIGVNTAF